MQSLLSCNELHARCSMMLEHPAGITWNPVLAVFGRFLCSLLLQWLQCEVLVRRASGPR